MGKAVRAAVIVLSCAGTFGDAWGAQAEGFAQEMRLAGQSSTRTAVVEHLRRALELRPDDPDNITIEYRIAVAMSQYTDGQTERRPNPADAIPLYAAIVEKYKHADYYRSRGESSTWDPQFMVPRARIHLASLHVRDKGSVETRRKWLWAAMGEVNETFTRRRREWLEEPRPTYSTDDPMMMGMRGQRRLAQLVKEWERRQELAAEGEVLSILEMVTVEAAVRQFGLTYGSSPLDAPVAMKAIVDRFPGTPMAKVAQRHADRAVELMRPRMGGWTP